MTQKERVVGSGIIVSSLAICAILTYVQEVGSNEGINLYFTLSVFDMHAS